MSIIFVHLLFYGLFIASVCFISEQYIFAVTGKMKNRNTFFILLWIRVLSIGLDSFITFYCIFFHDFHELKDKLTNDLSALHTNICSIQHNGDELIDLIPTWEFDANPNCEFNANPNPTWEFHANPNPTW